MKINIVYSKLKKLIVAAILSLSLLTAGYFINNLPIFTGVSMGQFFLSQKVCEALGIAPKIDNNDALFVNVSYDKDLAVKLESNSTDTIGNTAITDRNKLYQFLNSLKDKGDYKYIILDIKFDINEISSADSLLYSLIASMDNIVIIREKNKPTPRADLQEKSALAYYSATIDETSFARYQYLSIDTIRFIPLKVYEDLHPYARFKRHGWKYLPIYTSQGKLCYNSSFITFDSKPFTLERFFATETYDKISSKNYYNLGNEILNDADCNIDILSKDRYVIVGDFAEEDRHDTYVGKIPGALIIYRALKNLENEKHIVSFFSMLYWFTTFTIIFWLIISDTKISNIIPSNVRKSDIGRKIAKPRFLRFIIATFSYTTILFICSTIEFTIAHRVYSTFLPTITFMVTKLYYDYKKF